MSEKDQIQNEIAATAGSISARVQEIDRRTELLAQAVEMGARAAARRYPWLLLGGSIAAGILAGRLLVQPPALKKVAKDSSDSVTV